MNHIDAMHAGRASDDKPAILGGTPVRPRLDGESLPHPAPVGAPELAAAAEVIRSGKWSGGRWHDRAKEILGEITGAQYVSLCTNGTHALQVANAAVGVQAWSPVMLPGLTWQATAGNVLTLGGVPVMIDVDPGTLTASVEAGRTELERRTSAGEPLPVIVWVVGLYGRLPDLLGWRELIDEFSEKAGRTIYLGLDFAHGPGGRYEGGSLMEWVDVMTGSGQESKNAKAGEAGWICVNDAELHEQIESRITCGRPPEGRAEGWQSDNFRLQAIVAAPWCGQLDRYRHDWLPVLQVNARRLDDALRDLDGVEVLDEQRGAENHLYKYAFRTTSLRTDLFWRALEAELAFEVRWTYPALNQRDARNPYYPDTAPAAAFSDDYRRQITELPALPVAERAFGEIVAIEWAFLLEPNCVELLVRAISKIVAHRGEIERAYDTGALTYWFD
jgi:dTDP-4-amino-4,6-dideoxygalactose transaminase